jgi:hypothetical protein
MIYKRYNTKMGGALSRGNLQLTSNELDNYRQMNAKYENNRIIAQFKS